MLFLFSYPVHDTLIRISECFTRYVDIDMDKLLTINQELHAWISNLNNGDYVNKSDLDMYAAIVHYAQTDETGCIKPVACKEINILTKDKYDAKAAVEEMTARLAK